MTGARPGVSARAAADPRSYTPERHVAGRPLPTAPFATGTSPARGGDRGCDHLARVAAVSTPPPSVDLLPGWGGLGPAGGSRPRCDRRPPRRCRRSSRPAMAMRCSRRGPRGDLRVAVRRRPRRPASPRSASRLESDRLPCHVEELPRWPSSFDRDATSAGSAAARSRAAARDADARAAAGVRAGRSSQPRQLEPLKVARRPQRRRHRRSTRQTQLVEIAKPDDRAGARRHPLPVRVQHQGREADRRARHQPGGPGRAVASPRSWRPSREPREAAIAEPPRGRRRRAPTPTRPGSRARSSMRSARAPSCRRRARKTPTSAACSTAAPTRSATGARPAAATADQRRRAHGRRELPARRRRRRRRHARRCPTCARRRRCSSAPSAAARSITSRTSRRATRPRSTAKQWVYATFFNRMKRRVHQNWDPVRCVAAPRSRPAPSTATRAGSPGCGSPSAPTAS